MLKAELEKLRAVVSNPDAPFPLEVCAQVLALIDVAENFAGTICNLNMHDEDTCLALLDEGDACDCILSAALAFMGPPK